MEKKDQQLANESIKESAEGGNAATEQGNISKDHSMTTTAPQAITQVGPGVPIAGYEDLPLSMLQLPSCILVQAGTDVYQPDSKTLAPKGQWWFGDSRKSQEEITFVGLRAVVRERERIDPTTGVAKKQTKLYCLCANVEDSWNLFVLILPVTSFNAWGRMMAQLKKSGAQNSYEYMTTGRVQQQTNKNGQKYFVGDFMIADKLRAEDMEIMAQKYAEFGGVLNKVDFTEEE